MEKETVKDRLIAYLALKKISKAEFGRIIGVSSAYVTSMRKSIQPDKLDRIKSNFSDINIQWLLTGEGEMLMPPSTSPPSNAVPSPGEEDEVEYAGENRNAGVFFRDPAGELYISVPHVPYAARAEFPNLADSLEPLSEWGRETYKVDKKATGLYLSFDIRGDSMDNGLRECLQDGDKVLARELERDHWRTLRTGDHRFWVLVFGSSVLIKEIIHQDTVRGTVTCHSLNPSPEYHDFDVNLDEVRHLYYVVKIKPHEMSGI